MGNFSERYSYTKASEVIIREEMTTDICNIIVNVLRTIKSENIYNYYELEKNKWKYYFNQDIADYRDNTWTNQTDLFINYFKSKDILWYEKLNLLEVIISGFKELDYIENAIDLLNYKFKNLNFAYRIIDNKVIEITSDIEITSIEEALFASHNVVKTHLHSALHHLSASNKTPDYRNSIKESISAVEAICHKITGEKTLGKALVKLKKEQNTIHPMLINSIENLYSYTNDPKIGARHSLKVDEVSQITDANQADEYAPTSDEALFILVTCCAFVNFLVKKIW